MKNLIIISAGAFGREVYYAAKQSIGHGSHWKIKGFIDSSLDRLSEFSKFHPEGIIGTISDYIPQNDDVFICAIADKDLKVQFTEQIKNRGGEFINIIHGTAVFLDNVALGEGIYIGPNCVISCHASIGNHTSLVANVAVGHDVKIGNFCQLNSFSHLAGLSSIGDKCVMNPLSVLLPKVSVSNDCVIGVSSVVVRSVKTSNQSLFGNPAMPIL